MWKLRYRDILRVVQCLWAMLGSEQRLLTQAVLSDWVQWLLCVLQWEKEDSILASHLLDFVFEVAWGWLCWRVLRTQPPLVAFGKNVSVCSHSSAWAGLWVPGK